MAKPICVIYFNPEANFNTGGKRIKVGELNDSFQKKFSDYHTLVVPSYQSVDGSCEDFRVEVFNAEKMDDISLEQFKKELLETLLVGTG